MTASILSVLLLVFVLINVFMTRAIILPMKRTTEKLREIAAGEGNLSERMEVRSRDEIGDLAVQFNSFMDTLSGLVEDVKGSSKDSVEIGLFSAEMRHPQVRL